MLQESGSYRIPHRSTRVCASDSQAHLSSRENYLEMVSTLRVSSFPTNHLLVTPLLMNAMMTAAGEMRGMVLWTWLKRWIYCHSDSSFHCRTVRRSPRVPGWVNDPEKLVTNCWHGSLQDPTNPEGGSLARTWR